MKKLWFRAKDYGWGWYPSSWEGWTVLLVWAGLFIAVFVGLDESSRSFGDALLTYLPRIIVLTGFLILVCWKTGERPTWRWAGKPVSPAFVLIRAFGIAALAAAVAAGLTLLAK
jgi:hypothetical protein